MYEEGPSTDIGKRLRPVADQHAKSRAQPAREYQGFA
jgi:hypothetical protein